MHKKGFIHRDLKPDNYCIGINESDRNVTHLIDFGLAKRYMDPVSNKHIQYKNDKLLTGTVRYASIHSH